MKAEIKDKIYRFSCFKGVRGYCNVCESKERKFGVLMRMYVPYKRDLRICNECLIKYLEKKATLHDRRNKNLKEWNEKEKKYEKFKGKKKGKRDGLLSKTMDNTESGKSEIEKKDGRAGSKAGRTQPIESTDAVVFLTNPKGR
jgi:hypothetical protein